MKIVIVEDEIRIREGLARLIRKLDEKYEVVGEAENGREGLSLIKDQKPDIIITDIRMPEMDGLEMLDALYKEGNRAKSIVLSAYSEFEYARQAIRLGVKEYLLKPLVVGDISEVLHRVEEEIKQERSLSEEVYENIEQIFAGILWGGLEVDEALEEKLKSCFSIEKGTLYEGICLYLGNSYGHDRQRARKALEQLLGERQELQFLILEAEWEKSLLILIYNNRDVHELERWVQYWLLEDRGRKIQGAVGAIGNLKLKEMKEGLEVLLKHMDWNISLGDEVMISYPKITRLQTSPCIYPIEIEGRMKQAVCAGQGDKIRQCLEAFYDYFSSGLIYEPREIKECYVRFFWALMNTGKEVGVVDYENFGQQKLLEQIMGAKTSMELKEVGVFLEEKLLCEAQEEITHLTIKRAQSLIQEFYQSGITLEEIAGKLNITPEYLGTRFHKEMGMTFSNYMKNFRMTKAKELLIGTSLKLYEIAGKVGYSDPKYFSRVFKETTGQLPADYRKTHK